MNKNHRVCLISKIKGLAEESKNFSRKMRTIKDESHFYSLFEIKNNIRYDIRHHALAYAYLRQVPYNVVERKCNEKPSLYLILKVVILHSNVPLSAYKENLEKIQNWINGEVK